MEAYIIVTGNKLLAAGMAPSLDAARSIFRATLGHNRPFDHDGIGCFGYTITAGRTHMIVWKDYQNGGLDVIDFLDRGEFQDKLRDMYVMV